MITLQSTKYGPPSALAQKEFERAKKWIPAHHQYILSHGISTDTVKIADTKYYALEPEQLIGSGLFNVKIPYEPDEEQRIIAAIPKIRAEAEGPFQSCLAGKFSRERFYSKLTDIVESACGPQINCGFSLRSRKPLSAGELATKHGYDDYAQYLWFLSQMKKMNATLEEFKVTDDAYLPYVPLYDKRLYFFPNGDVIDRNGPVCVDSYVVETAVNWRQLNLGGSHWARFDAIILQPQYIKQSLAHESGHALQGLLRKTALDLEEQLRLAAVEACESKILAALPDLIPKELVDYMSRNPEVEGPPILYQTVHGEDPDAAAKIAKAAPDLWRTYLPLENLGL